MASEETLIQVRREKHHQLNGGIYPLATPSQFDVQYVLDHSFIDPKTSLIPEELGIKIMLHGRVSAFRKSGGISFLKLTDHTGSIQLIAAKNVLPDYDSLSLMDLGDIIEVEGPPTLSKTGEKSLLLISWKVLTKAHHPPPEKFVGLSDPELIYRKRYLDLMSSEESRSRFIVRSTILRNIRQFMETERFLEVETSTLSSVASGANAKPFTTHHNALETDLRLRIAPELNLKRLLVGGLDRVYEIGRAYRNEGIDTRHNPEFTIMEAYEAYGTFPRLIEFTQQLLRGVDAVTEVNIPNVSARRWYRQWKDQRTFTLNEFRQVSVYEAVMHACQRAGICLTVGACELMCPGCVHDEVLFVSTEGTRSPRLERIDWKSLTQMDFFKNYTPGQQWMALFEHVAEPFLTEDYRTADDKLSVPVFLTRYPKSVCPLARANDWRQDECDRFELFVNGRELANAFQELNDPDEQAKRFQEQLEHNHKDPMDLDADYIEALQHGMPPAIGFGMGIDRLVMLLTGTQSIKDVILFPTLKPVRSNNDGNTISQT